VTWSSRELAPGTPGGAYASTRYVTGDAAGRLGDPTTYARFRPARPQPFGPNEEIGDASRGTAVDFDPRSRRPTVVWGTIRRVVPRRLSGVQRRPGTAFSANVVSFALDASVWPSVWARCASVTSRWL
jgi:hypothetical protein